MGEGERAHSFESDKHVLPASPTTCGGLSNNVMHCNTQKSGSFGDKGQNMGWGPSVTRP